MQAIRSALSMSSKQMDKKKSAKPSSKKNVMADPPLKQNKTMKTAKKETRDPPGERVDTAKTKTGRSIKARKKGRSGSSASLKSNFSESQETSKRSKQTLTAKKRSSSSVIPPTRIAPNDNDDTSVTSAMTDFDFSNSESAQSPWIVKEKKRVDPVAAKSSIAPTRDALSAHKTSSSASTSSKLLNEAIAQKREEIQKKRDAIQKLMSSSSLLDAKLDSKVADGPPPSKTPSNPSPESIAQKREVMIQKREAFQSMLKASSHSSTDEDAHYENPAESAEEATENGSVASSTSIDTDISTPTSLDEAIAMQREKLKLPPSPGKKVSSPKKASSIRVISVQDRDGASLSGASVSAATEPNPRKSTRRKNETLSEAIANLRSTEESRAPASHDQAVASVITLHKERKASSRNLLRVEDDSEGWELSAHAEEYQVREVAGPATQGRRFQFEANDEDSFGDASEADSYVSASSQSFTSYSSLSTANSARRSLAYRTNRPLVDDFAPSYSAPVARPSRASRSRSCATTLNSSRPSASGFSKMRSTSSRGLTESTYDPLRKLRESKKYSSVADANPLATPNFFSSAYGPRERSCSPSRDEAVARPLLRSPDRNEVNLQQIDLSQDTNEGEGDNAFSSVADVDPFDLPNLPLFRSSRHLLAPMDQSAYESSSASVQSCPVANDNWTRGSFWESREPSILKKPVFYHRFRPEITLIQALGRGYLQRQANRKKGATVIQSYVRMWKSLALFEDMRARQNASILIQRAVRGMITWRRTRLPLLRLRHQQLESKLAEVRQSTQDELDQISDRKQRGMKRILKRALAKQSQQEDSCEAGIDKHRLLIQQLKDENRELRDTNATLRNDTRELAMENQKAIHTLANLEAMIKDLEEKLPNLEEEHDLIKSVEKQFKERHEQYLRAYSEGADLIESENIIKTMYWNTIVKTIETVNESKYPGAGLLAHKMQKITLEVSGKDPLDKVAVP